MLSFIVAFDPNQGIGYKGALPWHIREDLKLFKKNTMGKKVVMGQTTYCGLPRKLEGRFFTVISNDPNYNDEEVVIERDLIAFLDAHKDDEEDYIICGGASIYNQSYPYCKKAYISFVKQEHEVDTRFTAFKMEDWDIVKEVEYDEFIYRELVRKEECSCCKE